MGGPRYGDVKVGDALPPLEKRPDEVQLFLFSAATWDTHRTHFDTPYTVEVEKLPGLLVHGHLQGAFLTQLLDAWGGPDGTLVELTFRNRAMAVAGDTLLCRGQVREKRLEAGRGLVLLDLRVEKPDGTVTTEGTATVALPV